MTPESIATRLLDESSSAAELRVALDDFMAQCTAISGIVPDPGFDAWAPDTFLDSGVAINPQAAAHCVTDYQRSVTFIRGVYAAIKTLQQRFPSTPIRVLYAGCGPFATLLMPILTRFRAGVLDVHLLDVHPDTLDSVRALLPHFNLYNQTVRCVEADACIYQHPESVHLIIAETMQKSLEQEPQVAVLTNLAPQLCSGGVFIPGEIDVEICLARLESERARFAREGKVDAQALVKKGERYRLAGPIRLTQRDGVVSLGDIHCHPGGAQEKVHLLTFNIPNLVDIGSFELLLFTTVQVFGKYSLGDYESEITLPSKCHDLTRLVSGNILELSYQLGSYPKFCVTLISGPSSAV